MSLDRTPLPQLSLGAWQLKERGIEVAAVRVWHEVRERAVEVRQVVQELTGQVRDWLDRAAEGVDREGLAVRAAALREGREAEERHTAQEVAKEQERVKELERQQEIETEKPAERYRGMGYGL